MRILSWNIQYGKSVNSVFDFNRSLNYIKSLGDFDVICLQEVARHMTGYCSPDQQDQLELAQQHFANYNALWGSGFSWPSATDEPTHRQEFGNLTLVKNNLLDFKVHQLPQPAAPGKWQMPRVAIEACVDSSIGPLSIINTHLAFHDSNEVQQQLEHLHAIERDRLAHLQYPKAAGPGSFQEGYLASARILCGDFNFAPEFPHYQYQLNSGWIDTWKLCYPDVPQPSTCGIFDQVQWVQGGHCRDYFWLSKELASRKVGASVDSDTDLSDHQPIILEINI
ncbi:MAG: endonuclease/exonuclease/phosphatase family metal-dependent hydrolase [Cellvibrionaceae bacterium]|jgi:endonuclease/exonuclease/phosphatase family metal-dependent hydrolase